MTKVQIKRMDDVVQSYVKDNEFMGSVLAVHNQDVLLNKGYGQIPIYQQPNIV